MKNIIGFLEELGRNSDLRLDKVDFEAILENDDFDPEVRKAILDKDQNAIEMILNARSKIVCILIPAEEDDEDEDKDKDDSTEEDSISINRQERISQFG